MTYYNSRFWTIMESLINLYQCNIITIYKKKNISTEFTWEICNYIWYNTNITYHIKWVTHRYVWRLSHGREFIFFWYYIKNIKTYVTTTIEQPYFCYHLNLSTKSYSNYRDAEDTLMTYYNSRFWTIMEPLIIWY